MDGKLIGLIISLVAPLPTVPLLAYGSRRLFAYFLREAAGTFLGLEMHREWSFQIANVIAVINAIVFGLAWWAAVGIKQCEASAFAVAAPFIVALLLGLFMTSMCVKSRLRLEPKDAFTVGLLSFAGGNLPLILLIPVLLGLALGT